MSDICIMAIPLSLVPGVPRYFKDKGSREQTTMSNLDYYKKQKYLMDKKLYQPNFGYEPYWDEVGKPTTENLKLKTAQTTTMRYYACGEECSYLYLRMGEICARNISNDQYEGCWPILWIRWCYGDTHSDISGGYQTYENYCEFLDAQCTAKTNNKRLAFIHTGKCRKQDYFFPQMHNNQYLVDKAENFSKTGFTIMNNWMKDYNS